MVSREQKYHRSDYYSQEYIGASNEWNATLYLHFIESI